MEVLFEKLSDTTHVVLVVIIVLQQKQIMSFAKITRDVTQAITELSTLIKGMVSRSQSRG